MFWNMSHCAKARRCRSRRRRRQGGSLHDHPTGVRPRDIAPLGSPAHPNTGVSPCPAARRCVHITRESPPDTIAVVARSSESRWLWLGGGFITVAVALLGVAATFDTASKVPYSYGTSLPVIVAYILLGLSLVCFGCASREVPFAYPISRRDTGLLAHPVRSGATEPSATSATSSNDVTGASSGAGEPPSFRAPWMRRTRWRSRPRS
jgi:hypothetical protein